MHLEARHTGAPKSILNIGAGNAGFDLTNINTQEGNRQTDRPAAIQCIDTPPPHPLAIKQFDCGTKSRGVKKIAEIPGTI